jgi:hypothetical protein
MQIETLKTQQLQLLAQKALKLDEVKQIETALGQIGAILQFAEQQPAPQPEPVAE